MQYRAEIDGLRALAVIPVILFHAEFVNFSGGFVGVDVFFVISGYLITTQLINELDEERFCLLSFYKRRARRILPALFFVMFMCIPFAWFWMLPNQMKDFSQSLVATSLFSSNILFWLENGYFSEASEEKPLLHTWSLAVEEQYYLIFPLLLFFVWRSGTKRVFWVIFAISLCSLAFSEWNWRNNATANFYLAPSRMWELLAGSLAALAIQKKEFARNNSLAFFGLILIIFSIFYFDKYTPFPSLYTMVPVVGATLIIMYSTSKTFVGRILGSKILVGLGLLSYSAYLWHQPLFAFARIRLNYRNEELFVFLTVLSFLLAYLTWKFVETPFRAGRFKDANTWQVFSISGFILSSFICFGFWGHWTDGHSDVTDERQRLKDLSVRLAANHGISSACEGEFKIVEECTNSDAPKVLLWGDSYAMHLFDGLVASDQSLKIRQITKSSCSPILGISRINAIADKGETWANGCITFNSSVLSWLRDYKDIETVILSSPFTWVGVESILNEAGEIHGQDEQIVLNAFEQTVNSIKALGIKVVVVSPTPRNGENIGRCLRNKNQFKLDTVCDFEFIENSYQLKFLKRVEKFVPVYWLHTDICPDGICLAEIDGNLIYRDAGHLSVEGSDHLGAKHQWSQKLQKLASK